MRHREIVQFLEAIFQTHHPICQDKWPDAFPIVLGQVRVLPKGRLKVSPYEMVFGCPWPIQFLVTPQSCWWETGRTEIAKYLQSLSHVLSSLHRYIRETKPLPLDMPIHSIEPGDWVLICTWKDELFQPKWNGPQQVLLMTNTAVKLEGIRSWIRYSLVKKVPEPQSWTVTKAPENQGLKLLFKRNK